MSGTPHREGDDDSTGIIFDVKRFALHDGPGIRTTVFFKGCPLRCPWCQNPESWNEQPEHAVRLNLCIACGRCVDACEKGAVAWPGREAAESTGRCTFCGACVEACPTGAREIVGRSARVGELIAQIERDVVFYESSGGGVTFSGGEPFAQPRFLGRLLRACKRREIHTAVDTTCHVAWHVLAASAPDVDLYLVDLKHMDASLHERWTGVSNETILQNVRKLLELGREIIIRVPIIPGFNDDERNLAATARFVAGLGGIVRVDVLRYNEGVCGKVARLVKGYAVPRYEPADAEQMATIARRFEQFGLSVRIGG